MAPLPPFSASTSRDDVYRVGGHQVSYELLSTLKQASSSTGVDFAYLVAQAGQESGFRPDAQASGSSARGLFQFIDSTWLQMVRDHGAKYGLTRSEEHTSELQSLMRISYAVFCLKKKKKTNDNTSQILN